MGYGIRMVQSKFSIKYENKQKALKAVRSLKGKETIKDSGGAHFSFVDLGFERATSLEEILAAWRWKATLDFDSGDVVKVEFTGEKYGDDDLLFMTLAPFVEDGSFIEFKGEDGASWRYVFEDGKFDNETAEVKWTKKKKVKNVN